jgi:hypothetical protein
MCRVRQRAVTWLVAAWLVVPAAAGADDTKDVKAIATAKDVARSASFGPIRLKKEGVVIRSAEELVALTAKATAANDPAVQKETEAEVAKLLQVEAIDWAKRMILGVIGEEVESLKSDGKALTVSYVPFKEPLARAIPKTPKVLVLVERFEGEVKFVPKKK